MALMTQAADKPNILVVWGDDIGQSNISAYTMGVMGYRTPNIDRIVKEGMIFTDYYGEQSCTAGRSSFIMGQSVFRTGLSKVGLPGAELGMQIEDPTIAGLLKNQGYATGQFGKNHLGDKDEMLPTNHGFDEFYGNLYHLNAEEEPENEDYPSDPAFAAKYGPRGVIRSYADGKIEADSVSNGIIHHMDWLPTFVAAAGEPDVKKQLLKGKRAIGRKYKVHLDGYNFLPFLTGEADTGPRREIFYFSDDGDLTALRYNDWKLVFLEQKTVGTFRVWMEPFVELRVPMIENLRRAPYERASITSNTYYDWLLDRAYLLVPAQEYVGNFLATYKDYPPRQKAASFSLDQVMEKLAVPSGAQ